MEKSKRVISQIETVTSRVGRGKGMYTEVRELKDIQTVLFPKLDSRKNGSSYFTTLFEIYFISPFKTMYITYT